MGQALYRKYRSKSLDDIVGQEHITKTLSQAVKTNRISHAYLFTGPRGVGKTSIARILAHDINGLPYKDDVLPVDVIEIDAASNRRIDEIRELREKVYVAPTSAKYKVYIIDEVHMLTKEAFNALLKTLEEPPAHVIFILATTDAHKLPETIVSRTQRFQFKPIDSDKVVAHLKYIANQESIKIDDEALRLIAAHGQGSFRDSISLLDQAANYAQPVTADTINSLLGTPPDSLIELLVNQTSEGTIQSLVTTLNSLIEQGYPPQIIASQLSAKLRSQLVSGVNKLPTEHLLTLLKDLIDVPASSDPERLLEICLIKTLPKDSQHTNTLAVPKVSEAEKPTKPQIEKTQSTIKVEAEPEIIKDSPPKSTKGKLSSSKINSEQWNEVLNLLKSRYNTLYGIVRMARLDNSKPGVINLQFAFAFHQKRINDAKNRDIILAAANKVSGDVFALECVVNPTLLTEPRQEQNEPDLSAISSIFGGGEILNE